MPLDRKGKVHLICWSCIVLEIFIVQGLISAAYYHFTTTDYTEKDIVFASVMIGICVLLLGSTIVCLILYRRHKRRNKELSRKAFLKDQSKLSQKMKNIENYYGSDCAICLEPKHSDKVKIVSLTCKHCFHKPCIKTSLLSTDSPSCPVCRQPPQPFTKENNSEFSTNGQRGTFTLEDNLDEPGQNDNQPLITGETGFRTIISP